jgi:hypothetical protein
MKEEGSRGLKLGIRMGNIYDAGRRELAYGCRRSERVPQTIEPNTSAHMIPVMVVSMKKKGPYTVRCIKLSVFCYIMTVQNVVYVLCINLYVLSKL